MTLFVEKASVDLVHVRPSKDMEPYEHVKIPKAFIGIVPIMLHSQYCGLTHRWTKSLQNLTNAYTTRMVTPLSKAVLIIAEERMSNNHVYCFRKNASSKHSWVCETRSHVIQCVPFVA